MEELEGTSLDDKDKTDEVDNDYVCAGRNDKDGTAELDDKACEVLTDDGTELDNEEV
jgi:hypothetical protein